MTTSVIKLLKKKFAKFGKKLPKKLPSPKVKKYLYQSPIENQK